MYVCMLLCILMLYGESAWIFFSSYINAVAQLKHIQYTDVIFIHIHAVLDAGRLVERAFVCSMDIYYMYCICMVFFSTADLLSMCINHVHLLFFSLVIFQSVYIIRICIYVSVWEHLLFFLKEKKKKKYFRLRILCDLYSDYLDSLVMMLPL